MKRSKVSPGRIADTGMIRWPMNFPPSSNTAILSEASVGRTTCKQCRKSLQIHITLRTVLLRSCHVMFRRAQTFLKTIASSSQTGLMALPWDVFVLKAFLLVSTGRPNMSISTYVPTFLSDRNWPEMILKVEVEERSE